VSETGMNCYPMAALERTMKIQEVILRAVAKRISWWPAAEIIGVTDRQMRRWHWRYREYGNDGLLDRRLGKPSPRRVPLDLPLTGCPATPSAFISFLLVSDAAPEISGNLR
jgi:hypothetical protein